MKHMIIRVCAAALALSMLLALPAFAAETAQTYEPTDVTRSEDGTELRKTYELAPDQDPGGIPQDNFEQDGFYYELTDLLREEITEDDERQQTDTVVKTTQTNDTAAVLAMFSQDRAYSSQDGFTGTLTLQPDTLKMTVSYTNGTKSVTATRSYPNLSSQDNAAIPKTIEDNGAILTLQSVQWQTDNTVTVGGVSLGNRFTAVATYGGTVSTSTVAGYKATVTYAGTVTRSTLSKVRYVAVFKGVVLAPVVSPTPEVTAPPETSAFPEITDSPLESEAPPNTVITVTPDGSGDPKVPSFDIIEYAPFQFNWAWILAPLGALATAGIGISIAVMIKRRKEFDENGSEDDDEEDGEEDEDE